MGRSEAVRRLHCAREEFCGVGTRKVKLQLNRLAKTCATARAFRLALEIEDASSVAKKYGGEWRYAYYQKKHQLVHDLIVLCRERGWRHGKHKSDRFETHWIVYFDLPGCEQISFHADLDLVVPDYLDEWDGKVNSTLNKLETAIQKFLGSSGFEQRRLL